MRFACSRLFPRISPSDVRKVIDVIYRSLCALDYHFACWFVYVIILRAKRMDEPRPVKRSEMFTFTPSLQVYRCNDCDRVRG